MLKIREGCVLFTTQLVIQVLSKLDPTPLGPDDHQYHIGYETAKRDILRLLSQEMGDDFKRTPSVNLIKRLRND